MASLTCASAKTATLTTTTADTITFSATRSHLAVYNDDTATKLYVTLGVNGTTATTPTSGADDTYVVPPKSTFTIDESGAITSCKVVGNGNAYTVMVA